MHPETETVLERRRMRRSLSRWRAAAIAAVALAIGAFVLGTEHLGDIAAPRQIARLSIEGTITEDRDQLALMKRLKEAKHVQGVIVFVNSPGGTTTGGEAIYEGLRDLAKEKPVVAQFGTVAASAGYIVGLGADHIVARGNTITGSIGVLAQWPEFSNLLDKLGVKVNEVKSGALKAAPGPFAPMTEDSKAVLEETIKDGFDWFVSLVRERRGIDPAGVKGLIEGRIFSGREALGHRLVDAIGGEAEARKWLEETKGVAKDLEVVDWKPQPSGGFGFFSSSSGGRGLLTTGARQLARLLGEEGGLGTVGLDGLVSVWQPSEK
jgi:protease-4